MSSFIIAFLGEPFIKEFCNKLAMNNKLFSQLGHSQITTSGQGEWFYLNYVILFTIYWKMGRLAGH